MLTQLEVKVPVTCEVACAVKIDRKGKDAFVHAIDEDYRVHWIVDNLPVGVQGLSSDSQESTFSRGFPVGFHTGDNPRHYNHYLNNHIRIIIQYHDDVDTAVIAPALSSSSSSTSTSSTGDASNSASPTAALEANPTTKIVGFRVEPMSIHHSWEGAEFTAGTSVLNTCNAMTPPSNDPANYQAIDKSDTVLFTYDVFWEKSAVEWVHRWDTYLVANVTNDKVHWFSITNSFMIVLFLTVMIAMILLRALKKDIAQYNDPAALEEAKEESGWKLVHGDVFRPPTTAPMLFR